MPTAKPAPKPGAKGSKRVYIAVGLLALLVVGYLLLRSRSGAGMAASPSGASALPQTGGGSGDSSGQASADLLAALAGENQQLLKSFLASSSGLVSLAGASVGSPGVSTSTVGEPASQVSFASTTSSPLESLAAPQTVAYEAGDTAGYGGGADVYGDPDRPSYEYQGQTVAPITYASVGATPEPIPAGLVEPPDLSNFQAAPAPNFTQTALGKTAKPPSAQYSTVQGTAARVKKGNL